MRPALGRPAFGAVTGSVTREVVIERNVKQPVHTLHTRDRAPSIILSMARKAEDMERHISNVCRTAYFVALEHVLMLVKRGSPGRSGPINL
jgi:hypothetical protein